MMSASPGPINIVGKYVDGLHVSVVGEHRPAVLEELREEKVALRASSLGLLRYDAIFDVPGGALVLTTSGGSKYQFILQNDAIKRLEVTSRGRLPQVMIQFWAKTLYEYDLEEVGAIVESIAGHFLEPRFETKLSRVDIALDFQCAEWQWPEINDIACRARNRDVHYDGTSTSGMTFGNHNGPLQVVMYDKNREIKKHNKAWMEDVWATKEAYNQRLPVVRAELRFFRDLLRDFDMKTISDLRSGMGDLVSYAVGEARPWFRVASPESRGRKTERRKAAPWWDETRKAFLEGLPETGRIRQRSPSSRPDPIRARSMSITSMVKTAAWNKALGRYPTDSPEAYLGRVPLQDLDGWLEARSFKTWEEAVDFEAKKIGSSGRAPYPLVFL
jgi:hypothetical protein